MDARRQRRQRSRDPLDRRFDQWIETGRQLVDGVSGARPGQRGASRAEGPAIPSLDGVGRWVGDKIDWLMDEEEDWREPWEAPASSSSDAGSAPSRTPAVATSPGQVKRALQAISRRSPPALAPAQNRPQSSAEADDWPDEASFRVDRWSRQGQPARPDPEQSAQAQVPTRQAGPMQRPRSSRSLPRSTRRRD
ncbi:MAG: RNA helicase [Prochlorococcus sp.]